MYVSVLLGVLASVLPNLLFKRLLFSVGKHSAKKIVKYFYWGAISKYLAMLLLIGIILQWQHLQVLEFCIAMLATEFIRWLILLLKLRITTR